MIRTIVDRASTVWLLVVCVLLFGMSTYTSLPREAAPDIDIPVVMVTTPYQGVSPADVESLVTTPIENELAGVKDVKKMSSTSAEGVSLITLEFEPEADIDEALQRVRDRVSRARSSIPEDTEETTVNEISFADMPILIVTLAGGVEEEELKRLGEELEEKVERIPGVLNAELSGGRTREIQVYVDPVRLEHYALSMNDVIGAIRDENVNIPGGDIAVGDTNYLVRVPGEFETPADVEDVAIKRRGDRPVFVSDVARVVDGFARRSTYARMNGEAAVSLAISKRTGANILELSEAVKAEVAEQAKGWPEGVRYRALGDQSKMIRDMVSDLENGIITALLLVVSVIMFFMGVRNSLFVAIAIPLSFLLGIMMLSWVGTTLNMIVLFSLILALGMLVDNAIVIVENVYRHLEEGKSKLDAAVVGTREVAMAVTASTATTVAAFAPLLWWTGLMGEFMGYLPLTVILVLVASLVVAIAVLPVITSGLVKLGRTSGLDEDGNIRRGLILRSYRRLLEGSIRFRYLSAGIGVATLIGSFMAYGEMNHGTEFFPETEPNRATIMVKAPDGTDLEATDSIVRKVEGILAEVENVDVYVAEVGVSGNGQDPIAAAANAANQARVTIDFLPDAPSAEGDDKVRVELTSSTVEEIRQQIEIIPGAEISIQKEVMGPPVGAPIAVEVAGDDFREVGELAGRVRRDLSGIDGTAKLTDNYRVGRPEMRLRINRGAAKRVGASTQAVAGAVRTAIAGTKATALRDGEDEYDIVVQLDPKSRRDMQSILAMRIPGREDTSPDTFAVPLASVASYEIAGGSGSIRHIDQDLVVTIEGQIAEGYNQNEVQQAVMKWIETADIPPGFDIRLGGANDEQKDAQEFLQRAFAIAIFLIATVLVSQFNRFDLPLIILASVVLSLVGVLWGLILTGTPFGIIMTGLGVISLAGVVVNNAIVLLDYVEQLRSEGRTMHEALVRAGMARFRPVILTALTTILGLVPMALGIGIDFAPVAAGHLPVVMAGTQSAQWWGPMAVAVIFGLAFATLLTLVLVPTMYSILEDFRRMFQAILQTVGLSSGPAADDATDKSESDAPVDDNPSTTKPPPASISTSAPAE
ncbi:MAG: efflux RND transporter permease subunit [Myxococcales bacterium FL481]|nr:MAG: efflux RND transporter permease subunit [Myxococcales bacterium FL481]